MTGTPTTVTADATYTLTMQDEYGRQTSDTFTLEITVAGDTTAPTATITAGTQQSDGTLELTFTDLTEDGTMGIVWTSSDQSAAAAADVKTAAEGGTALTDQLSVETQAVTVGGGPYDITNGLPSGQDGTVYYQIVLWDSAGNISSVSSGSVTLDTTGPTFSSAEIGTTDDTSLIVTMSETLGGTTSTGDWTVNVNGSPVSLTSALIVGDTVDITLTSAVANGDTVTVAYTGSTVTDDKANPAQTFTAQGVANNVAASSAAINSITGTTGGAIIDYTGTLTITGTTGGADAEAT